MYSQAEDEGWEKIDRDRLKLFERLSSKQGDSYAQAVVYEIFSWARTGSVSTVIEIKFGESE